jgi:hypothetical protein
VELNPHRTKMAISAAGLADVFPCFPEWATDYHTDAEGGVWVYSEEDRSRAPYRVWHPSHGDMAGDTRMRLTNMDFEHGRHRGPYARGFLTGYARLLLKEREKGREAARLAAAEDQPPTVIDPDQCYLEF